MSSPESKALFNCALRYDVSVWVIVLLSRSVYSRCVSFGAGIICVEYPLRACVIDADKTVLVKPFIVRIELGKGGRGPEAHIRSTSGKSSLPPRWRLRC